MLIEDVKRIVHELDQGQQLSSIGVELVDNELAILYMNSKKSEVMLIPPSSWLALATALNPREIN